MFTVEKLSLPGVLLIKPKVFSDVRGYSVVPYHKEEFEKLGITVQFVHDYTSYSVKDVIRGLHFQRAPHAQDKLVRCTKGKILDVVADCDPASATFGTHVSAMLTSEDQTMLYIPGRYAHGFCVVSDDSIVEYKMSDVYHPESAGGVLWNDPLLHIEWPTATPILSDQDTKWPPFKV